MLTSMAMGAGKTTAMTMSELSTNTKRKISTLHEIRKGERESLEFFRSATKQKLHKVVVNPSKVFGEALCNKELDDLSDERFENERYLTLILSDLWKERSVIAPEMLLWRLVTKSGENPELLVAFKRHVDRVNKQVLSEYEIGDRV